MAVPSVSTIRVPNNSKKKTIGTNQNFFRTLKNSQNSDKIDNLDIHIFLRVKIVSHNLDLVLPNYYDNSNENQILFFLNLKNLLLIF